MKRNFYSNTFASPYTIVNSIINSLLKSLNQIILIQEIDSLKKQETLTNVQKCQETLIKAHYFPCQKQPQKIIQFQIPAIANQNRCKSLKNFLINYKVQRENKQKCNQKKNFSLLMTKKSLERKSSRSKIIPHLELLNLKKTSYRQNKINQSISLRKQENQFSQDQAFINYMRNRQIKIEEINNIFKQRQYEQICNQKQLISSSYLKNKLKFTTQYDGKIIAVKQNKYKPITQQYNPRMRINFKLRQIVQCQQAIQPLKKSQDLKFQNQNRLDFQQQQHNLLHLKFQDKIFLASKSQICKQKNLIFKQNQYKIKKITYPIDYAVDKQRKNLNNKNKTMIGYSAKYKTMTNSPMKIDSQIKYIKQGRFKKI